MKTTSRTSVTQSGASLARLSQLDIAVARHARSHDDHASPIVGCYLCLHGVVRFERDSAPLPDDTPAVRARECAGDRDGPYAEWAMLASKSPNRRVDGAPGAH